MLLFLARMVAGTEERRGLNFTGKQRQNSFRLAAGLHHGDVPFGLRPLFSRAKREAKSDSVPKRVAPKSLPLRSTMRVISGRLKMRTEIF